MLLFDWNNWNILNTRTFLIKANYLNFLNFYEIYLLEILKFSIYWKCWILITNLNNLRCNPLSVHSTNIQALDIYSNVYIVALNLLYYTRSFIYTIRSHHRIYFSCYIISSYTQIYYVIVLYTQYKQTNECRQLKNISFDDPARHSHTLPRARTLYTTFKQNKAHAHYL